MTVRALVLIAAFTSFSTVAAAQTCEQLAHACLKKGGVPATCFEENRMKRCKSTGTYTAPNGTTFSADKK